MDRPPQAGLRLRHGETASSAPGPGSRVASKAAGSAGGYGCCCSSSRSRIGAHSAVTALAEDNVASLRVSLACGYREYRRAIASDGVTEIHLALTAERWCAHRLPDGVVEGAEEHLQILSMLDIDAPR